MKRKLALQIIAELRHCIEKGEPHNLTFIPCPRNAKPQLQEALNDAFDRWRRTWLLPNLDRIETLIKQSR